MAKIIELGNIDTSQYVNVTGAQSIGGVKTFNNSPVVPTPSAATQSANKQYVDTTVDNKGETIKLAIPTALSELQNDTNFITVLVDNLANYYKKSELYTQEEINTMLGQISSIRVTIISEFPKDPDGSTIYLKTKGKTEEENVYDEYMYVNNKWEKIGDTTVDLSNYYTIAQTDKKFEDFQKVYEDSFNYLSTYINNNYVNNFGNQQIEGVKTFISSPVVPSPSKDGEAANKAYVDTVANEYLPIVGGTLKTNKYNGLTINRADSADGSSILFSNTSGNLGKLGFDKAGQLILTKGAGTDGAADMLKITNTGVATFYGNVTPDTTNTKSLGTSTLNWSNVYATNFIGDLKGSADTAIKLAAARKINGVPFDGSQDITIDTGVDNSKYWLTDAATGGIQIPDGSDLNDYKTYGTYYVVNATHSATIINNPKTTAGFTMYVVRSGGTVMQIIINLVDIYIRRANSSQTTGWEEWKHLVNNIIDNLTSTSTVAALSAKQGKALNDSITTLTTADTNNVKLSGAQTIAGVKTFSSVPVCSTAATSNTQLVNKKYVDDLFNSIIDGDGVSY